MSKQTSTTGSRIIIITGGSGSGKTLLANHLIDEVFAGDAEVLSHDMYYIPADHFEPEFRVDYDAPESLDNALLRRHLAELREGRAIEAPIYDFKTHTRLPATKRVEPKRVIIVEGILTLAVPELRELADLTIFIHVDDDIRLSRRVLRDFVGGARGALGTEGLPSELSYYFDYVKPNYQKYIAPLSEVADIVLHNNARTPQPMVTRVESILSKFQLK